MAAFGTQINPALGRIDYSPLLQGAQMAAAGRQRGTEMLQQGISQGFEDYLKKREQNAVLEGRNASLVQAFAQDPTLKQFAPNQKALDSLMAKMAKGGGLTLNDNIKLNAELQTTVDMAEKAREANRQAENVKYIQAQTKALVDKAAEDKRVRDAMSATMAEIGKLGGNATPQQIINIGVANNMPLDNLRSLVGMNMDVAQLGSALKIADENLKRVQNENIEAERRRKAFADTVNAFGGKSYRIIDAQDGTKVFERLNLIDGKMEAQVLEKGSTAAAIQGMVYRQEQTDKIYAEYLGLINRADRESPENISLRDKLAERYNIINKDPAGIGIDRFDLDKRWGGGSIIEQVPTGKGATAGKGTSKPNIKNAAVVTTTQQPAASAPAAAPANLSLAGASTGFAGGARGLNQMGTPFTAPGGVTGRTYSDAEVAEQQRRIDAAMGAAPAPLPPPAAPAPDTTIGAPVQAAPPVVLSPEAANPLMAMGITGYGATGFGRSNAFDVLPTATTTTPSPFQRAQIDEEAFPARRTTLGQRMAENARVQSLLPEGQDVMGGPSGEGLGEGVAKGFEQAKARAAREGRLLRQFGGTQRFQMDPMGLPMAGSTALDPRSEAEQIALAEADESNTPDITYRRVMAKLGFPTEAQRNVSAIPFRMEPSDEARTVGTPREEGKKAFEAAARAFGPALSKAKVELSEQLIPELVKTGQTAVRVAKQMVREELEVPVKSYGKGISETAKRMFREDIEIPLKSYGKGIAAMAKALSEEKRYTPDSESISRLPSGKVMSITEILADPQAAGLGPTLAATALTSIKLDSKAQRIANDLLDEYRRNEAAAQGRAPTPSLRSSNATVRYGNDLYGTPNLRRVSGGVGQPTPRYNLQPPEEPTQSDTFRNRMESRELTERNMRNRELERQMEQMLRSRRRSSR